MLNCEVPFKNLSVRTGVHMSTWLQMWGDVFWRSSPAFRANWLWILFLYFYLNCFCICVLNTFVFLYWSCVCCILMYLHIYELVQFFMHCRRFQCKMLNCIWIILAEHVAKGTRTVFAIEFVITIVFPSVFMYLYFCALWYSHCFFVTAVSACQVP